MIITQFEATGFTHDIENCTNSISQAELDGFNQICGAEGTYPPGVLGVKEAYITADDNQDESEGAKVFVVVKLLLDVGSTTAADRFKPPVDFLTRVADMIPTSADDVSVLDLDASTWEVSDADESDTVARIKALSNSGSFNPSIPLHDVADNNWYLKVGSLTHEEKQVLLTVLLQA